MTTQEMLNHLLSPSKVEPNWEIIGTPRPVPHGGIAVDFRTCKRRSFAIYCYQVYGTEETLSHALEILRDHNADFDLRSAYVAEMSKNLLVQQLSTYASIKVFPLEPSCSECLEAIDKSNSGLDFHASYVFMNTDGTYELGFIFPKKPPLWSRWLTRLFLL